MRTEGFFKRWSRLKGETAAETIAASEDVPAAAAQATSAQPAAASTQPRRPTLDDVALLGPDSDYSGFVAQGVDKAVRRGALKKLFSDPHFHRIDGLDIYMGDYTRPDPVSAAMLAGLQHAQSFFAQASALEAKEGPASGARSAAGGREALVDSEGRAGEDDPVQSSSRAQDESQADSPAQSGRLADNEGPAAIEPLAIDKRGCEGAGEALA
jgi:Protein of unknown function (DUF3306)